VAYEGWVDVLHPGVIGGWARDTARDKWLVLDVLRGLTLLGQAHTGAFRDELVGRSDCDAACAFWFEPKDPLEGLDQIQVRVTGTDYYLPFRKDPIPA
jgi:hypothetical protein